MYLQVCSGLRARQTRITPLSVVTSRSLCSDFSAENVYCHPGPWGTCRCWANFYSDFQQCASKAAYDVQGELAGTEKLWMRTNLLAFLSCLDVIRFLDLYVINKANLVCLRTFQKYKETFWVTFISIFSWLQKSVWYPPSRIFVEFMGKTDKTLACV